MKLNFTRTLMVGLVGGLLGISFAQGAKADAIYTSGSWFLAPDADTVLVESPTTVERVITSPVMIEKPMTMQKVIETPVVIERKERRHLLNFDLLNLRLF